MLEARLTILSVPCGLCPLSRRDPYRQIDTWIVCTNMLFTCVYTYAHNMYNV